MAPRIEIEPIDRILSAKGHTVKRFAGEMNRLIRTQNAGSLSAETKYCTRVCVVIGVDNKKPDTYAESGL